MSGLSAQQKQDLYEHGYVVIPKVVPLPHCKLALKAVNSSIGQHFDTIRMKVLGSQELCPELKSDPRIKNLFMDTPAKTLAEGALGMGKIILSTNIQIALRFPVLENEPKALVPHVDGFHPSENGNPGSILPFTAIAGIFLNDIEDDWAGNFTVWPGTHRLFADYFRNHHADPDLKFGIPPVDLPNPVQLKVKAGDMVLAHFQLAHTASTNLSDAIRYAVYFRMNHKSQPRDSIEALSNIWKYWDGMPK